MPILVAWLYVHHDILLFSLLQIKSATTLPLRLVALKKMFYSNILAKQKFNLWKTKRSPTFKKNTPLWIKRVFRRTYLLGNKSQKQFYYWGPKEKTKILVMETRGQITHSTQATKNFGLNELVERQPSPKIRRKFYDFALRLTSTRLSSHSWCGI